MLLVRENVFLWVVVKISLLCVRGDIHLWAKITQEFHEHRSPTNNEDVTVIGENTLLPIERKHRKLMKDLKMICLCSLFIASHSCRFGVSLFPNSPYYHLWLSRFLSRKEYKIRKKTALNPIIRLHNNYSSAKRDMIACYFYVHFVQSSIYLSAKWVENSWVGRKTTNKHILLIYIAFAIWSRNVIRINNQLM